MLPVNEDRAGMAGGQRPPATKGDPGQADCWMWLHAAESDARRRVGWIWCPPARSTLIPPSWKWREWHRLPASGP